MEWQIIVALAIAIPIILFPVALIWYINIGGIYSSGNERKIVLLNCPDIYFELVKKTVRWYPGSRINNPVKIKKVQRNA
jgi:hypothetical protein